MSFLNPTYLWSLLGLLVPVAIHLWSKRERKTLFVGSLKFLGETHSKKASSFRLNEYFLLFLRLSLLALLVLILAEPVINRQRKAKNLVYLVEPSLYENKEIRELLDSLPPAEFRFLQEDFPPIDPGKPFKNQSKTAENRLKTPPYWQLLEDIPTLNADSIVIYTKALERGIKGKRPEIEQNINWITINPEEIYNKPVAAYRFKDSIKVVSASGNSEYLAFSHKVFPTKNDFFKLNKSGDSLVFEQEQAVFLQTQDTFRIQLYSDSEHRTEQRYITAAFQALEEYTGLHIQLENVSDENNPGERAQLLIWLKGLPVPEFSGVTLGFKPDPYSDKLIEEGTTKSDFYLTEALNAENSIDENLATALFKILKPFPNLEEELRVFDTRSQPKEVLKPIKINNAKTTMHAETSPLSYWFWLALIILLITERITAFYRKQ